MNLAFSGTTDGAFSPGTVLHVVGDSSGGKSMLANTILACTANNQVFDEYELYYDDTESADDFDGEYLFGRKYVSRVSRELRSTTIEELTVNVANIIKRNVPFIYVVDSVDALSTEAELGRVVDAVKAAEKRKAGGKAEAMGGTYSLEKQKQAPVIMRTLLADIAESKGFLILISQAKENIGGYGKRFSGGAWLTYYSSYSIWLLNPSPVFRETKKIGSTKNDIKIQVGTQVTAQVKKNRKTGKWRNCLLTILSDYGVDDIGSCVDYLVEQGVWAMSSGNYRPTGLYDDLLVDDKGKEKSMKRDTLFKLLEQDEQDYIDLKNLVKSRWEDVEAAVSSNRRGRFE